MKAQLNERENHEQPWEKPQAEERAAHSPATGMCLAGPENKEASVTGPEGGEGRV